MSTPAFLKAASDLREMAEREPERARAMERFKNEGTEESWIDAPETARYPSEATETAFENGELSRLYIGALFWRSCSVATKTATKKQAKPLKKHAPAKPVPAKKAVSKAKPAAKTAAAVKPAAKSPMSNAQGQAGAEKHGQGRPRR